MWWGRWQGSWTTLAWRHGVGRGISPAQAASASAGRRMLRLPASAARLPACQALAARGEALNRGAQHWGPSLGGLEVLVEGHGVVVGVQGGHDARLLVVAHL